MLDQKEKDAQGSPHLVATMGLVSAVVEEGDKIGAGNLKVLKRTLDKWSAMSPEELNQESRMCRQCKCWDKTKKRLVYSIVEVETRLALKEALKNLDFVYKIGRAPASFMERELADWLQYL